MIFLTVGTQLSFDRLVRAMDAWAQAHPDMPVFGQIADPGQGGYRPSHIEWKSFIGPNEFAEKSQAAKIIVAHAGIGSIETALTLGKPIVIMPRRASLGEHRNEHQQATADKFRDRDLVEVAAEEAELGPIVDRVLADNPAAKGATISPFAEQRLIDRLRAFLQTGSSSQTQ